MVRSQTAGNAKQEDRCLHPGVVNPQYPSAWWTIGFTDEVRVGEVVPTKVLERDIVLWRDSAGTLHCHGAICPHLGANLGYGGCVVNDELKCPFHGWQFSSSGAVTVQSGGPGGERERRFSSRRAIEAFRVEERYGAIFLWNGLEPVDHELPDLLEVVRKRRPGISQDQVTTHRHGFFLPYPAKWFAENGPDSGHFPHVHRIGQWGEADIIAETSTSIHLRQRLQDVAPYPSMGKLREQFHHGELTYFLANAGDVDLEIFASGLSVLTLPERVQTGTGPLDRALTLFESSCGLICWTPVTATSHVFRFVFLTPKIEIPILGRLVDYIVDALLIRRDWAGIMQDSAIMLHRQEPASPAYTQGDRALIRFRKLWDSRILDRQLEGGDNMRSNGARAGIRWRDDDSELRRHSHGPVLEAVADPVALGVDV